MIGPALHKRAVLALLLATALPAWAADGPREIVEQIYARSAGADGKYQGASAFDDASLRKRWFTKSLVNALTAMDRKSKRLNEPILDFDPVTNSQDPDVNGLVISVQSATTTRTIVLARFSATDARAPDNVRYIFVKEGAAWKLDDIRGDRGGEDKWSLRKIIK